MSRKQYNGWRETIVFRQQIVWEGENRPPFSAVGDPEMIRSGLPWLDDLREQVCRKIDRYLDGEMSDCEIMVERAVVENIRHNITAHQMLVADSGGEYIPIGRALAIINERLTADGRNPISKRRLQAIARHRHDLFGVGRQVGGRGAWIFRASEIDALMPRDYNRGGDA